VQPSPRSKCRQQAGHISFVCSRVYRLQLHTARSTTKRCTLCQTAVTSTSADHGSLEKGAALL
jgi:hypothetical protein